MDLNLFLDRFDRVKPGRNGQYTARCPCHDDRHNSLSIRAETDGSILVCCHAGCATEHVVGAVGLTMADLYPDSRDRQVTTRAMEKIYLYAGGQLRKRRFYQKDGTKSFIWEHLQGDKWEKGKGDLFPGLYKPLEPLADTVFLVEGEKDADTLAELGLAAVSLPNGAGAKWEQSYGQELQGHQVIILPDNDEPGRKYACLCAENLYGVASAVCIAALTTVWEQMPDKGDITDLMQHFGREEGRRLLAEAVTMAPLWEPKKAEQPLLALCKPLSSHDEGVADWVVPGWIPEGQITILASDGGVGKTTVWADIVAKLSSGRPCLLDPEGISREALKILFFSAEDSVKKKLKKKLREAGANEDNILAPDFEDDTTGLLAKVKFGSRELEAIIAHVKPDLCIFDPIQGYIPRNVNMASRNEIRGCMEQLVQLGAKYGTTFLLVCHSNKRMHAAGRDRLADSADIWDAARTVIMAGYTGDSVTRYLSVEKSNYGAPPETVLFDIDARGQVVKKGTTWKHDKDFRNETDRSRVAPQRRDCKDMILSILHREPSHSVPSKALKQELEEVLGFSKVTVERACNELRQEGRITYCTTGAAKKGNRQWYTMLVVDESPEAFEELCQQTAMEEIPFA